MAAKNAFDFATVKSCTKYLLVKYESHNCAWMLQVGKYDCLYRFHTYKYIGEHSYGVQHANKAIKNFSQGHCFTLFKYVS